MTGSAAGPKLEMLQLFGYLSFEVLDPLLPGPDDREQAEVSGPAFDAITGVWDFAYRRPDGRPILLLRLADGAYEAVFHDGRGAVMASLNGPEDGLEDLFKSGTMVRTMTDALAIKEMT